MGTTSTKDRLLEAIKKDNEEELIALIKTGKPIVKPDEYINESESFTALNIASSFGSRKAASLFLQSGWSVDLPEKKNMNSPLLLACKFGYLDIAKLLVEAKANLHHTNNQKINSLDMAIISGHYAIAYYLVSKELKINTIDYYKSFIVIPFFNVELFYSSLSNGITPENAPSFALKKTKEKSSKDKDKEKEKGKCKEIAKDNNKDKDEKEIIDYNKGNGTIEVKTEEINNGTGLVLLSESKVLQK